VRDLHLLPRDDAYYLINNVTQLTPVTGRLPIGNNFQNRSNGDPKFQPTFRQILGALLEISIRIIAISQQVKMKGEVQQEQNYRVLNKSKFFF
jgi:hypothetical protein